MRRELTRTNHRLTAFGFGILATLAFGWAGAAGSAEEAGRAVPVCIGADRVLQLVESDTACRDGEQRFLLASAGGTAAGANQKKPPAKKPAPHAPRPLEVGDGVNRFTAPFEVVDKQGLPILSVRDGGDESSRGIYIYNSRGNIAVQATDVESGGGRVQVRDGKTETGNWAGIGYTEDGPLLAMKSTSGKNLFMANRLGLIWFNANEVPAVKLGAGESGKAGYFSVADEKGTAVVEAGSLQDGRGVVRVFPSKGQTPVPIPQFLMGSKP